MCKKRQYGYGWKWEHGRSEPDYLNWAIAFCLLALGVIVWQIIMLAGERSMAGYSQYQLEKPQIVQKIPQTMQIVVSYYTASRDETDDTPCITADGTNICPAKVPVIANNCLSFGTKVRINGTLYEVHDRMAQRFGCEQFDILLTDKAEAIRRGRHTAELQYE